MTENSRCFKPLKKRYRDAYAVASTMITIGNLVKIGSLAIGVLAVVIEVLAQNRAPKSVLSSGEPQDWLPVLITICIAASGFISGVVTAAFGQFMSAAIDTAVNTSANITADEKAQILELV